jgi:hypothetical protein
MTYDILLLFVTHFVCSLLGDYDNAPSNLRYSALWHFFSWILTSWKPYQLYCVIIILYGLLDLDQTKVEAELTQIFCCYSATHCIFLRVLNSFWILLKPTSEVPVRCHGHLTLNDCIFLCTTKYKNENIL